MFHELRHTLRTLKHNPSFAAIAVLTLALGIGANTAMFSVVNGVLLRPLDYPNASRIVQLNTPHRGRVFARLTGPDVVDIRADASALEQVSVYYEIVGVAPASFNFPRDGQVWLATAPRPWSTERTAYNFRAVALMRPGVSLEAANAQLQTIGARLQTAFPDSNREKTFLAVPLQE